LSWDIQFERRAQKEFNQFEPAARQRILKFLVDRVAPSVNPRSLAEPLQGDQFSGLWRFRVGDYRLIAHISDQQVLVLVVRVGHRRNIYR
jgi:mRNA interferase RelE/StbE